MLVGKDPSAHIGEIILRVQMESFGFAVAHRSSSQVVDSADRLRMQDCKAELSTILTEERLAGASLLILANKQDLPGALTADQIRQALESYCWRLSKGSRS